MTPPNKTAVLAGISKNGLGEAICRALLHNGYQVAAIARRDPQQLLQNEFADDRYMGIQCDLTQHGHVQDAIHKVEDSWGSVSLYIHNAAMFHQQNFLDCDPHTYETVWRNQFLSAVTGIQSVLPGMIQQNYGTIAIIGATASIKAGAGFSAFASAKFALRGLAQSLARELGPHGIHVIHPIIDGIIWGERAKTVFGMHSDQCLMPADIANTLLDMIRQPKNCWTHEIDLRPYQESF